MEAKEEGKVDEEAPALEAKNMEKRHGSGKHYIVVGEFEDGQVDCLGEPHKCIAGW